MKKLLGASHVALKDASKFVEAVEEAIATANRNGWVLDIQYQPFATANDYSFTALILAYKEEE